MRFYHIALPLGVHLTAYFTNIKDGNIKDYRVFWHKETNENTIHITGFTMKFKELSCKYLLIKQSTQGGKTLI
jgi:hypothetical protein